MYGFKSIIYDFTNRASGLLSLDLLIKLVGPKFILPYYHLVCDKTPVHIKHLYQGKNVNQFKSDLEFLLKKFSFIHPDDFPNKLKIRNGKVPLLMTFDDGLIEFHDIIAPILLEKGLSAICFLNPLFIDNKDLFYRYKVSILIEEILKSEKRKTLKEYLSSNGNPTEYLLKLTYKNRSEIDEIAKVLEVDFNSYLSDNKIYMSSSQIKTLSDKGFRFGAHSMDHPLFSNLTFNEQFEQFNESVDFVIDKFGVKNSWFSFPFTDDRISQSFFDQIDYSKVKATFGGAGIKKEKFNHHFQRISLEKKDMSADKIIKAELFYYLLKMPLLKNTIHRK